MHFGVRVVQYDRSAEHINGCSVGFLDSTLQFEKAHQLRRCPIYQSRRTFVIHWDVKYSQPGQLCVRDGRVRLVVSDVLESHWPGQVESQWPG